MTHDSTLIRQLLEVLEDERRTVRSVLEGFDDSQWLAPTPAEGWDVRDQIIHLAHFDFMAGLSLSNPEAFRAALSKIKSPGAYVDSIGPANLSRTHEDILLWWRQEAEFLEEAAAAVGAGERSFRAPWFGVSMSPASMITARIMETWAHGQDVLDTAGVERAPSAALDSIAHLGVRAFANSYAARGKDVPEVPVRVELEGFGGKPLEFGPAEADNRVVGTAEDFALVVTQRRHVADTGIAAFGPVAEEWMHIAQAFAGAPGAGRRPGQFL